MRSGRPWESKTEDAYAIACSSTNTSLETVFHSLRMMRLMPKELSQPAQVITTTYQARQEDIMYVRRVVFIEEQSVPPELEIDGRDHRCLHALALVGGRPVGTGRIDLEDHGKVGRVAVLSEYRGQGIGTRLMAALVQVAKLHRLSSIWFHAQESAIPFYEKLGYSLVGESFLEAGILHRTMRRTL